MSRNTPRFTLAIAACGVAFACAGIAQADTEVVIRTVRDGPCSPGSQPLAVGSDGRIWIAGWCSGAYVNAFAPDGSSTLLARRQMAADPYGDSASQVLPQSDGSAWVVGGQQSGSPPSCRLMRATTGALELVQQEAGCVALSVADDAVVTVRQIQALNTYRVRTEKFLADGTRAWSRDSAATGGSWLKLARGANGAVHVATTTRDTPRIAVISYAADGTSLPEVLVDLGGNTEIEHLASDATGALFAAARVYVAGTGFHEEVVQVDPGVGATRRVTVPPALGYIEALHAAGAGPIVIQSTRGEYNLATSVSVLALAPDFSTRWTRTFDEQSSYVPVASALRADGRLAIAISPRPNSDARPRFIVLKANGDVVTDVLPALPTKTIPGALEWLADGDIAIGATGFSGAETYGYGDEILAARLGEDGAVRWMRTEGALAQQTRVNAIFPGAGGRFAVVTASPKPNPPPAMGSIDAPSYAIRLDAFDASGAATLRHDFPITTNNVAWAMPTADGGVVQLSSDDWFVAPKSRISRIAASPALEWEHVVDDGYSGIATQLGGGDIAYGAFRTDGSWTFGAISTGGQLRFESPLSPPVPAAPTAIAAGATGGADIVGWTSDSTGVRVYCGSFDVSGVPGPVNALAVPGANTLAIAPGSSFVYGSYPYLSNIVHVGRASCAGSTLWDVELGVTPPGTLRSIQPDATGGAWVIDYRWNPTTVRARHYSAAGDLIGAPGSFVLPLQPERFATTPDGRLGIFGFVPGPDSCGTAALAVFAPDGNLAWTWVHDRTPAACESWPSALVADGDDWLLGTELRVPGQPAAAQVIRVSARLFSNGFE